VRLYLFNVVFAWLSRVDVFRKLRLSACDTWASRVETVFSIITIHIVFHYFNKLLVTVVMHYDI
jgi:hypothetical protein